MVEGVGSILDNLICSFVFQVWRAGDYSLLVIVISEEFLRVCSVLELTDQVFGFESPASLTTWVLWFRASKFEA